jgi:hypothetical protein
MRAPSKPDRDPPEGAWASKPPAATLDEPERRGAVQYALLMIAIAGLGLVAGTAGGHWFRAVVRDGTRATQSTPAPEGPRLGATVPDLTILVPAASEVRGEEDNGRPGGLHQELTPIVAPPTKLATGRERTSTPTRSQRSGSRPIAAEKVTEAPAGSPSAAVRATERDRDDTDASDIVDWFIKEFPRQR